MANARSFADRLNDLFHSIRPGGLEREYTNVEVAQAVGISDMYIGLLRRGLRANPSADLVRRLERFFGLTEPYLCNDDQTAVAEIDEQLGLFRTMRDNGVLPIAMRAAEIHTAAGRDALAAAIEEVLARERDAARIRVERRQNGGPDDARFRAGSRSRPRGGGNRAAGLAGTQADQDQG